MLWSHQMLCACLPCSPFIMRTDGCAWTSTTSPHSGGVNDGLVDNSPSRWQLWLLAKLWFCSTDMIPWGYLNYRCESPHWGKHHNLGSRDGHHTLKSCQLEERRVHSQVLVWRHLPSRMRSVSVAVMCQTNRLSLVWRNTQQSHLICCESFPRFTSYDILKGLDSQTLIILSCDIRYE